MKKVLRESKNMHQNVLAYHFFLKHLEKRIQLKRWEKAHVELKESKRFVKIGGGKNAM